MTNETPWGNYTIEHEKVEDDSPDTWLKAARESNQNSNYNQSLQQTKRGRELVESTIYAEEFDFLDISNYYGISAYSQAREIKNKYNDSVFIRHFSENLKGIQTINHYFHQDSKTWTTVWYGCIQELLEKGNYYIFLQYKNDIDTYWINEHVVSRHIKNILEKNSINMFQFLEDCYYPFHECKFDAGKNITMMAITLADFELVNYIIQKKYNSVDDTAFNGDTCLFFAIDRSFSSAVTALINQGANVNHKNNKAETPLIRICSNMSTKEDCNIINQLIKAGADVHVFDAKHRNLVQCVIRGNFLHITGSSIRDLIHAGVDIKSLDIKQHDALYDAALLARNVSAVETLINFGADVNHRYEGNMTILHLIAQKKHWNNDLSSVWHALLYKANLNLQDNVGYTCLMYSVDHNWTFSDELDMARQLVKYGADTNLKSNNGNTVQSIMRSHNIDPQKLYNNKSSNFFTKLFS